MLCFSSRRRHTRWPRDWSSDVCSSDLSALAFVPLLQPEWRVPGWHWIAFSLTVVAAGVFALPVHAAAVRRLSRGLMTFQVGVSVTVIVLLVWSVLASDGPSPEGPVRWGEPRSEPPLRGRL